MKILVIEDDASVAKMTKRILSEEGYLVDVAVTGSEGQTMAFVGDYDLIVLDLGLPDLPGLAIVHALRREGRTTPILVLTGSGGSESTVRALDAGADDYNVKPISPKEFTARVRALVRRGGAQRTESLTVGNVVLNRLTHRILVDGTEVQTTAREFALVEHLLLHTGELVTRSALLTSVWETQFDSGTNVVDVTVSRLRKKLRDAGARLEITSRRGEGFVLTEGE